MHWTWKVPYFWRVEVQTEYSDLYSVSVQVQLRFNMVTAHNKHSDCGLGLGSDNFYIITPEQCAGLLWCLEWREILVSLTVKQQSVRSELRLLRPDEFSLSSMLLSFIQTFSSFTVVGCGWYGSLLWYITGFNKWAIAAWINVQLCQEATKLLFI